jgi:hypothetical protein
MMSTRAKPTVSRDYNLSSMRAGRTLRHGLRAYVLPVGCNAAWPGVFHLVTIRAAHAIPVSVYRLTLRFESLANVLYRWLVSLSRRIFH